MKRVLLYLMLLYCAAFAFQCVANQTFDWKGATVYFVITDRFCNGDSTNDVNYGRITDYGSERMNAATFHGGDFRGLLEKAKDGYFTDLGVDVLWMTDVYEQIHGWMSGSGAINDFPHYGYHGYYPLDYTQTDKNYGTVEELRQLVDTLHAQGIRVMLGANLNDPGYPTLLDAAQYGFAETGLSAEESARHIKEWSYDDFFAERLNWTGWYDREWIRMPDEDWDESNPLEATLYGMPDFKDESVNHVRIPTFLKEKWRKEGDKNNAWVNPAAAKLRKDRKWAPSQYLIGWIASWVEELGIDGFRCDIVENVHMNRWRELNQACNEALKKWRAKHKGEAAADWTDNFYMTGDIEGAGIEYKPEYAKAGFSSIVNCYFPKRGDLDAAVYTWQAYADSLQKHDDWQLFSYLNNSYHRDSDMSNMTDCGTTLLLAPGTVQIFYGDETDRKLSDAYQNVDSAQAFRSDMNWNDIDMELLEHFRRLGKIRKEHPVIATGRQLTLDSHSCVRYNDTEKILVRLKPEPDKAINMAGLFPDGTCVTELYSGQTAKVRNGAVVLPEFKNRVAIFCEVSKQN